MRGLHGRLKRDDIVLADRYYGSYFEFALLLARGVDLVTRQNKGRAVDFRRGRRLGQEDHLVEWTRPRRASWMDKDVYATIPEAPTVRELRVRVGQRGFRVELNGASPEAIGGLIEVLLRMVSRLRVGDRPDRYEPRERKRRAKAYPLMHQPRGQSKKLMAKAG